MVGPPRVFTLVKLMSPSSIEIVGAVFFCSRGLTHFFYRYFRTPCASSPQTCWCLASAGRTEPLFVFAIMVIAATRPILQFVAYVIAHAARALPIPRTIALYLLVMIVIPLLGSFITEPAALCFLFRGQLAKNAKLWRGPCA